MTAFSIPKLSLLALLTLGGGWLQPSLAQSIDITRIYDQNLGQGVKVHARTRFLEKNNRPLLQVNSNELIVKSNGQTIPPNKIKVERTENLIQDPSRIIILLDLSGSMNEPDISGKIRGVAAINAIRSVFEALPGLLNTTQVSLVPFAEKGRGCDGNAFQPPPVTHTVLDKFSPANSVELNQQLSTLENKFKGDLKYRPCGATNIRDPLKQTIQYFKDKFPPPEDLSQARTRLGIILISDGYDPVLSAANRYNKPEIKEIESLLKTQASFFTLYTLGYGVTNSPQEKDRVDTAVLDRLARASGGQFKFSGDEGQILAALKTFLQSLLGEFEIIYPPTITEPESRQTLEISRAGVSAQETFRLRNIPTLPFKSRLLILLGTLVFCGLFGVLPFLGWRSWLEKKA